MQAETRISTSEANYNRIVTPRLKRTALWALTQAYSDVSGFPVGAAALVVSDAGEHSILAGWNTEIDTDLGGATINLNAHSYHAEAAIVSRLGRDRKIKRVMIFAGQDPILVPACGQCRHSLMSKAAEGGLIFVRDASGKNKWIEIKSLLPNSFHSTSRIGDHGEATDEFRLFHEALSRTQDNPFVAIHSDYATAAVLTRGGRIYSASDRQQAAFYHSRALQMSIDQTDSARDRAITKALFLYVTDKYDDPVFPCGAQRQDLYEASQIGANDDIPLIVARNDGRLWHSTIRTIFPYPFGPEDVGADLSSFR